MVGNRYTNAELTFFEIDQIINLINRYVFIEF